MNLSDYLILTENEEKFLNLGYGCHIPERYGRIKRQVELEILNFELLAK